MQVPESSDACHLVYEHMLVRCMKQNRRPPVRTLIGIIFICNGTDTQILHGSWRMTIPQRGHAADICILPSCWPLLSRKALPLCEGAIRTLNPRSADLLRDVLHALHHAQHVLWRDWRSLHQLFVPGKDALSSQRKEQIQADRLQHGHKCSLTTTRRKVYRGKTGPSILRKCTSLAIQARGQHKVLNLALPCACLSSA